MQKNEEISNKQDTILSKLEVIMNKIAGEKANNSNSANAENTSELKKENKRLTEEVDALKKVQLFYYKKLNSLNNFDKKLNSIGFIFSEEAKECIDAVKKIDPSFSTECELNANDSNNLENQISMFFNDIKVALSKLSSSKEISIENKSSKEEEKVVQKAESNINKSVVINDSNINNNINKQISNQAISISNHSPSKELGISKDKGNAEILRELSMLRRKLVDYEVLQDELNYYKNLSLNYHKVNNFI